MENNREKRISFRVTANERAALEMLAARENRDLSEMCRELVREGAARRGLPVMGLVRIMGFAEVANARPQS